MIRLPRDWSSNPTPIRIFIANSSGAGVGSLAYNTSGLVLSYSTNDGSSYTTITLTAGTLGTWSSGGFVADPSMTGAYWVGLPTPALPEGGRCLFQWSYNSVSAVGEIRADQAPTSLTSGRGSRLDNLDATVSSRSAPGSAQTITPADTAAATTAQTTIATNLNAQISSRMATFAYTTPPTTAQIAAAILTNPGNLLTTDATGKVGINNLPVEFLSSTEQTELTNAISDLNSILSSDTTFASNFTTVQTALNNLTTRLAQAILFDANGNVKSAPQTAVQLAASQPNYAPLLSSAYTAPDNTDIAAIKTTIGTAGAGLTAIPYTGPTVSAIQAGLVSASTAPSWYSGSGGGGGGSVSVSFAQAAAALGVSTPPAGQLGIRRGDSASLSLTALGSLAGRSKLWFTIKPTGGAAWQDSQSTLQVIETSGLQVLNGAAPAASSEATLTATDPTNGAVTIAVGAVATAALEVGTYHYDVQVLVGTTVTTLAQGTLIVSPDVTRATN